MVPYAVTVVTLDRDGREVARVIDDLGPGHPCRPLICRRSTRRSAGPGLGRGQPSSPQSPTHCLDYLDHVADVAAAEDLVAALADPIPRVRRHAIHALSSEARKLEPFYVDSATPLRPVIVRDPSARVRFEALRALLGHSARRSAQWLSMRATTSATLETWLSMMP
ncbi:MAG: HEAT repeat domain-containing protein [Actinomycetota bacterium]|nr:HEAT repeat domain-containing protein [Actinomycetota bacterium]